MTIRPEHRDQLDRVWRYAKEEGFLRRDGKIVAPEGWMIQAQDRADAEIAAEERAAEEGGADGLGEKGS